MSFKMKMMICKKRKWRRWMSGNKREGRRSGIYMYELKGTNQVCSPYFS